MFYRLSFLCPKWFLPQRDLQLNVLSLVSQALLLCKKEMIYRDAGVAVRQALSGNITDTEVGLHPEHYDRLDLDLDPSTAVFDRWRLYRIHHFAVVADQWPDLSKQVTREQRRKGICILISSTLKLVCIGTHASVDRMHWIVQMANRKNTTNIFCDFHNK